MKTKKIKIKSFNESLRDFKRSFVRAKQGKAHAAKPQTYFSSLEAVRKVMTQERLKLLKAVKVTKPQSIYELAKLVNRDFKNVSQDVQFLADMGLIELKARIGHRRKKPILLTNRVILEFTI